MMKLLERIGAWISGAPAAPAAGPAPIPTTATTTDPWFPLPGGILELGDTGFSIVLNPDAERQLTLRNPEGRDVAWGYDWQLPVIKAHAELSARSRAEFAVGGSGWEPGWEPPGGADQ